MSYSELQAQVYGASPREQEVFECRAYYEDDLDKIFKLVPKGDRPNIPSGLCGSIVDRSVSYLFPEGTKLETESKELQDTLKAITEDTGILDKLKTIGTEGHVTGTVGLKTIWLPETPQSKIGKWGLDILELETLEVEHEPLNSENIVSIRIRFRYKRTDSDGVEREYWWQEKWTEKDYFEWLPQLHTPGLIPNFTEDMINRDESGPHPYGEIPITIIPHYPQLNVPYGLPEINSKLKAYSKALSISLSKSGIADQLIQTPAYVRKNSSNKDRVVIKPASIIDVDSEGEHEADFAALEHPDIPESSFEYQDRIEAKAYDTARVTNPKVEKEMKSGGTVSSVAWKQFNLPFIKKIDDLRVRYGDKGIESHVEKILRMGKLMGLEGYDIVNPDDITSYEVQLDYPPFFEPTTEEKTAELDLYKEANLPAKLLASKIAMLLGIQAEDQIAAIEAEVEKERAALEPPPLNVGA